MAWRALNFRNEYVTSTDENVFKSLGTFRSHNDKSKEWNNGAYLAETSLQNNRTRANCYSLNSLEDFFSKTGSKRTSKNNPNVKRNASNKPNCLIGINS